MKTARSPTPAPEIWVQNGRLPGLFGWLWRGYAVVLCVGVGAVLGFGRELYREFARDLPDVETAERYRDEAAGVTTIHASDGTLLAEIAREHRAYTSLDEVPQVLIDAFLSAEDRRFWEHEGLDFRGLGRALVANLRSGTVVQGGSTITQQVAKSFLSDERTLERKIREAILSLRIESRLGKSRVLEIYLNKIFLGHGAYGVRSAANRYFDKELAELTVAECALIAGLARAPSRYSPVASPERAIERRAVVLDAMVASDAITTEIRDQAAAEPLRLASRPDPFRLRGPYYAEHVRRTLVETLGEEAVLHDGLRVETPARLDLSIAAHDSIDRATRKLDRRQGWRGPVAHLSAPAALSELDLRLTGEVLIDSEMWRLAIVREVSRWNARVDLGATDATIPLRLASWASRYDPTTGLNDVKIDDLRDALEVGDIVWVRPAAARDDETESVVELGQTPLVEGALYTFDHQTGYVAVMEGGRDYDRSVFDRTTQACRQPGSVFKAFYYSLALDGPVWRMDSILEANPWQPEPGEEWNPRNIDKTLTGKVLLRTALIHSMNTPSIRLFVALGADPVVAWLRRLGVQSELIADKGLSLGASCMRTDELDAAFGVFARGGSRIEPTVVRRAIDKLGRVRVDARHPYDGAMDVAGRIDRMAAYGIAGPTQVIDERTAWLISRLLREVVTAGIGARAGSIGVPVAGKTGTASGRYLRGGRWIDYTTDTWFVGFTSSELTSAWMGFDDASERSLGDLDASYTTAIPLWVDYMKILVTGREYSQVPAERPPGIVGRVVDATTGGAPIDGLPQAIVYERG